MKKEKEPFEKSNSSSGTRKIVLSHRLYPGPHGEFPSYVSEVKMWTGNRWRELISKKGEYQVIQESSTVIFPFMQFVSELLPTLGARIHGLTRKIEFSLGKNVFFRKLGLNYVIITTKKS